MSAGDDDNFSVFGLYSDDPIRLCESLRACMASICAGVRRWLLSRQRDNMRAYFGSLAGWASNVTLAGMASGACAR